jgi:hypothetical protein
MSKKYPMPNFDNMTPTGLVDEIGRLRERQKEAKFYEGVCMERLKAFWPQKEGVPDPEMMGEKYCLERKVNRGERLSVETLRTGAANGDPIAKEALAKYSVPTETVAFYSKELAPQTTTVE